MHVFQGRDRPKTQQPPWQDADPRTLEHPAISVALLSAAEWVPMCACLAAHTPLYVSQTHTHTHTHTHTPPLSRTLASDFVWCVCVCVCLCMSSSSSPCHRSQLLPLKLLGSWMVLVGVWHSEKFWEIQKSRALCWQRDSSSSPTLQKFWEILNSRTLFLSRRVAHTQTHTHTHTHTCVCVCVYVWMQRREQLLALRNMLGSDLPQVPATVCLNLLNLKPWHT
jgi:hypothetical protein